MYINNKLVFIYYNLITLYFVSMNETLQRLAEFKIQQRQKQWAFVRANYLPLIFSTIEVLILPLSKHCHTDNNICERDHKNGKAACSYKHFTQ